MKHLRSSPVADGDVPRAPRTATATVAAAVDARPPSRWSAGRLILLAATGLCLYVFFPSIAEVFKAWDRLGEVHPAALVVVCAFEFGAFACMWVLQKIALRTKNWFAVITTHLAGNAFNRVTPGGGATGTALQARMLQDAGFDTASSASTLFLQSVLMSATVMAMPIIAVPAIVFAGTSVPGDLASGAWIGAGIFVVLIGFCALMLGTRAPVARLGGGIQRLVNLFRRRKPKVHGLSARLLRERDQIRATMGNDWLPAVGAAVGRWTCEYFVLLVTLYAIGASPDIWLVLLAFVVASALSLIPITPGGLGFVEAGMTGTLALAGVSAQEAVLATLVFRLVSFWLPLPVGAVAAYVFRRRYPRRATPAKPAPAQA